MNDGDINVGELLDGLSLVVTKQKNSDILGNWYSLYPLSKNLSLVRISIVDQRLFLASRKQKHRAVSTFYTFDISFFYQNYFDIFFSTNFFLHFFFGQISFDIFFSAFFFRHFFVLHFFVLPNQYIPAGSLTIHRKLQEISRNF